MLETFAVFTSVGLLLSALVHACTFVPSVPVATRYVWPLLLWVIASVAGMIAVVGWYHRKHWRQPRGPWLTRLLGYAPLPARRAVIVLAAYGVVMFLASPLWTGDGVGSPARSGGEYYLHNHGHRIRDLTRDQYLRLEARQVRRHSGFWMIFLAVPSAFFVWIAPQRRHEEEQNAWYAGWA